MQLPTQHLSLTDISNLAYLNPDLLPQNLHLQNSAPSQLIATPYFWFLKPKVLESCSNHLILNISSSISISRYIQEATNLYQLSPSPHRSASSSLAWMVVSPLPTLTPIGHSLMRQLQYPFTSTPIRVSHLLAFLQCFPLSCRIKGSLPVMAWNWLQSGPWALPDSLHTYLLLAPSSPA